MGKQVIPGISTGGGGVLKKVVGAIVLLAVFGMVVNNPADSATLVKNAFEVFTGAVNGLSTFFKNLAA